MIHVWMVQPEAIAEPRLVELAGWLLPGEHERKGRFITAALQREYLVTRVLARWALSQHEPTVDPHDWVFERTENDRPFVPGAAVDFNLSNTPWLVACAVSEGRIGLDVELLERGDNVLGVSSWCFSDEELAGLAALPIEPRRIRAVELWALKESYVKARGDGIAAPLRKITFRGASENVPGERGRWVVAGAPEWVFELTHVHGHAVAVAGRVEDPGDLAVTFRETWFRP